MIIDLIKITSKICCLSAFLFFFSSCKPASPKIITESDLTVIKVDSSNLSLKCSIDSLIDEINFVPIETSDKGIIGDVNKIRLLNDKIVLIDERVSNAVYILKKNGAIVKKLASPERNHISDFTTADNKIQILLDFKKRIEYFNDEGKHIATKNISSLYSSRFDYIGNDIYGFWNNTTGTQYGNDKLILFDIKKNKFVAGFLPFPFELSKNINPHNVAPFSMSSNDDIYVSQPYDDTVRYLSITKDNDIKFYPKYLINFDSNQVPPGFLNDPTVFNKVQAAESKNFTYFVKGFMNMNSFVFFTYCSQKSFYRFIWDKRRKVAVVNTVELGLRNMDLKLPNNLQQVGPNLAAGYYHSYELLDWINTHRNIKMPNDLATISSGLTKIDNPILIFIKFK